MTDITATTPTRDPIGEKIAQLVDTSVNRRLTPIRRVTKKALVELAALSKEVTELKAHPTVDPMALMMAALGSAEKSLENLDTEAVAAIEKEFETVPTPVTT